MLWKLTPIALVTAALIPISAAAAPQPPGVSGLDQEYMQMAADGGSAERRRVPPLVPAARGARPQGRHRRGAQRARQRLQLADSRLRASGATDALQAPEGGGAATAQLSATSAGRP